MQQKQTSACQNLTLLKSRPSSNCITTRNLFGGSSLFTGAPKKSHSFIRVLNTFINAFDRHLPMGHSIYGGHANMSRTLLLRGSKSSQLPCIIIIYDLSPYARNVKCYVADLILLITVFLVFIRVLRTQWVLNKY